MADAYTTPYIDDAGLHIPTYASILEQLIDDMKTIFGSDIYLENDSMDYQQLSIHARFIYDTYLALQMAYSSRSPAYAVGVALDSLSPLFGVYRIPATKSNVELTITGESGTILNHCIASDSSANKWVIPDGTTIPDTGAITVQCESEEYGRILSAANTITNIDTPVYGWLSVTNNSPSTPGVDTESDASLRARMFNASFAPAYSILEGMISTLNNITGVTRVVGYENDQDTSDANGIPPHSICMVVDGGTDEDIATQIYMKKTPGVGTYGTTSVDVTSIYGNQNTIKFYRPTATPVYFKVALKQLAGYNPEILNTIKEKLNEYLDTLQIGDAIYNSSIWGVILSAQSALNNPTFAITSVQMSTDGSTYSTNDITCAFNEYHKTDNDKITITVTQ